MAFELAPSRRFQLRLDDEVDRRAVAHWVAQGGRCFEAATRLSTDAA